MTGEELLSLLVATAKGNMIIFPCVANDTGRKILHSLDPIQVVFRGVPSNVKT